MVESLLLLVLFIAALDWIAIAKAWRRLEYVAKPGVMVALLAWMWAQEGLAGMQAGLGWFFLGLTFSLAGDVFLLLPRERFISGLGAFLLGHLAYLVGFNQTLPPVNVASLILLVLVGGVALQLYRRISAGLERKKQSNMKTPVLMYSVVISLMLVSALTTLVRQDWQAAPALLVSAGALLFFLSDSLLAWNRFVTSLPHGQLVVIICYHLGQVGIVLGSAMHF